MAIDANNADSAALPPKQPPETTCPSHPRRRSARRLSAALQAATPARADRAGGATRGGVGATSPETLLREPAYPRCLVRTPHPASQPSCGLKLMPCSDFSTSKERSSNFRCTFTWLDHQHKNCIRTSFNFLLQLAGAAIPASWSVMSLRDSRAACTERGRDRPSPSASLSGPGCLPDSASAWTYAARPYGARDPGCRDCSWPRKHESITRVKSVQ